MPTISVIVPVYKVEEYLPACIRSILRQTYRDFELILVDDGSPDRCGEICDEFAKLDERIRVIHQENGGVSKARNTGMDQAKGEWITFVDSDDLITPKYLEFFFNSSSEPQKFDISIQGLSFLKDHAVKKSSYYVPTAEGSIQDILSDWLIAHWFVWGKLYKMNIIRESGIRFPEGITCGEDAIFYYQYLIHSKRIKCTSSPRYLYRVDNITSATHSQPDPFIHLDSMEQSCDLVHQLNAQNRKNIKYPRDIELQQLLAQTYTLVAQKRGFPIFSSFIHRIRTSEKLCLRKYSFDRKSSAIFFGIVLQTNILLLYYIIIPIWILYIKMKNALSINNSGYIQ